ncbi:MAG: hypothetical protein OEL51_02985 [Nitrosopumilus sp.]|nr:hypothetical protein [Nitrosopumilus sp.]MDH3515609.1 hypothetical protein [Nitrosopumilus sp.]MDH5554212.1 hypothetical protein [Nitrosopumilus sp.]
MEVKIFGFLVILLIISIIPMVNAQISVGEKAVQRSVEVVINSAGDVHVKHVINPANTPKQVELVNGTISNIQVTNEHGKEQQFSVIGANNGVLIMPSNENSILKYNIEDALIQENNVLAWNFRYLETTSFILPEEVDLIFANGSPVYLDEKKGITCHGCQMVLEYSINEPKILENVKWEEKQFIVEINSHSNIEKFNFDQPTKSITFNVSDEDRFVTTLIPLELLWKPYSVFLNDEKIYFHEYNNNGTHVWLNMKPETSGEIVIIGTTAIPEFPIIAPLVIGFLMVFLVPFIQKFNLH